MNCHLSSTSDAVAKLGIFYGFYVYEHKSATLIYVQMWPKKATESSHASIVREKCPGI